MVQNLNLLGVVFIGPIYGYDDECLKFEEKEVGDILVYFAHERRMEGGEFLLFCLWFVTAGVTLH